MWGGGIWGNSEDSCADLNVKEIFIVREIILVQRHLERQAPGEAVTITVWFWNVKT